MKAEVLRKARLEDVPSASGLTVLEGIFYITGDDAPYVYVLNPYLELIKKYQLFEPKQMEGNRIPKSIKPDFESSTQFSINNFPHVLVLGSGSKSPQRDVGYLVKLPTRYNRNPIITQVPAARLYNFLKLNEDVAADGNLNIEASATTDQHIALFNRRNAGADNTLLLFEREEFIEFAQGHTEGVPFPYVKSFKLPSINEIEAGFSGADFFDGKVFFSASVEDTPNAIDDGEILGSFIGLMDIPFMNNLKGFTSEEPKLNDCVPVTEEGKIYKGKIESINIVEKFTENSYSAVAVTDNDDGKSDLVMLEITL